MNTGRPVRVALADDAELVVLGLERMVEPYAERVVLVPQPDGPDGPADITLIDVGPLDRGGTDDALDVLPLATATDAGRVVVWSWDLDPREVQSALEHGAAGYLAKMLPAADLVSALERIHAGETVVSPALAPASTDTASWPGREQGLTARESEIIRLISHGLSNQQIADRAFLSINSVKSYIRSSYRKMGVTSRSRAVLWGIEHGFRKDR